MFALIKLHQFRCIPSRIETSVVISCSWLNIMISMKVFLELLSRLIVYKFILNFYSDKGITPIYFICSIPRDMFIFVENKCIEEKGKLALPFF